MDNSAEVIHRARPILMSGPMVRAILEGRKTQTRRVVTEEFKRDETISPPHGMDLGLGRTVWDIAVPLSGRYRLRVSCPYGEAGDRLWVRETFCGPVLCATGQDLEEKFFYAATEEQHANHRGDVIPWKPSIHMPRTASRITLEVTGVRVERVQEITEEDALAEGINRRPIEGEPELRLPAIDGYQWLWDLLNAKRGFGWEKNPWVWVVEFKRT